MVYKLDLRTIELCVVDSTMDSTSLTKHVSLWLSHLTKAWNPGWRMRGKPWEWLMTETKRCCYGTHGGCMMLYRYRREGRSREIERSFSEIESTSHMEGSWTGCKCGKFRMLLLAESERCSERTGWVCMMVNWNWGMGRFGETEDCFSGWESTWCSHTCHLRYNWTRCTRWCEVSELRRNNPWSSI